MPRLAGIGGALEMWDGVGGADAIGCMAIWGTGPEEGGAGAMGCIVVGLTFFGGLVGTGGVDPLSSPLLTKTLSGRPRHLMEDKYFLALEPALSSNSFGVSHSSPSWMHLPLLPDSYLFV